jgi:FkbH-like protein
MGDSGMVASPLFLGGADVREVTSVRRADGAGRPFLSVAIAASFTAEPLEEALKFWLEQFDLEHTIDFAPYNQVLQQLLIPNSLLDRNLPGANLILLRLEDWARYQPNKSRADVYRSGTAELTAALRSFASRCRTPTFLWVAPPSPGFGSGGELAAVDAELREELRIAVESLDSMHWLGAERLEAYSVAQWYDAAGDLAGHIPFTQPFYTALATVAARQIHACHVPSYKVLALDCDNTLWDGVVGEDGPQGITLPPGKRLLQEFAIRQQEEGLLLCLLSKNAEADVLEVFNQRPDMPLRREHLVAWRIGWESKAQGLREQAAELNLGVDSFIFLDDSPVECAEMKAAIPEALTLQLPGDDSAIGAFLSRLWAFDRGPTTGEDRKRTRMYQQNAARSGFQQEAKSIAEFLAGLELEIEIAPPTDTEWPRVSQLTQRTNQFNFTTIRRSEAEVRQLVTDGYECLRIKVADRFGQYGLVGVMIYRLDPSALHLDTMLLSCRVLGRGVEHTALAHLAEIARARALPFLEVPFRVTAKNLPAAKFLDSVAAQYRHEERSGTSYRIPTDVARSLKYTPGSDGEEQLALSRSAPEQQPAADRPGNSRAALHNRIATEFSTLEAIHRAVELRWRTTRRLPTTLVEPQTRLQHTLAELWATFLHVDRLGIHDTFEDLGGTSLIAARLFAAIEERLGVHLPLTSILEAPTIAKLAERIESGERDSIQLLRPGIGSGPALFLVHDGDGQTLLYRNLARRMPPEVAVYGIEPHGTDQCPILHTRIPQMAAWYIQRMEEVCREGPYLLAGMCAGGVIAFEMALQLRRQRRPVAGVFLLDATAPGAARRATPANQRRGARFLQAMREPQEGSFLTRCLRRAGRVSAKVRNLASFLVRSWVERMSTRVRFPMFRKITDRGARVPSYLHHLSVRTVYVEAEKEYRPSGKLDLEVTLFRATSGEGADTPSREFFNDPDLGWGPYAAELRVIDVSGGHSSMLQEPEVEDLAEKLAACISVGARPVAAL